MASHQQPVALYPFPSQGQENVLEKLRELRLWQQRQQEELLLQHQLELDLMRNATRKKEEEEEDEDYSNSSSETTDSSPKQSPLNERSVPRSNPLQPAGHTLSGSSISSNQSVDSGMLSGQSCPDVDMMKGRVQEEEEEGEGSSGFETPESDEVLSESDEYDNNKMYSAPPPVAVSHDDQPLQPGIGPGQSASTFEELLESKLQQYQEPLVYPSTQSQPAPLARCSSQDSFFIRKEIRKETEEAELAEFELLEKAAQETSFTSQCSIVTRALTSYQPTATSSPLSITNNKKEEEKREENKENINPKEIRSSNLNNEAIERREAMTDSDEEDPLVDKKGSPPLPALQEEGCISDFNSTLTSEDEGEENGAGFGDEDEWGSFRSTPLQVPPQLDTDSSTDTSPCVSPGKTIYSSSDLVRHHHPGPTSLSPPDHSTQFHHCPISLRPSAPVRKIKALPSNNGSVTNARSPPPPTVADSLPPPSSLVAKLFPSLNKERTLSRAANPVQPPSLPPPPPPLVQQSAVASPRPGVESSVVEGVGGLSADMKVKLAQLEREINAFKNENATLEKLRVEKEQGLYRLKEEVEKFEREKELEMSNFEAYKEEEIRKLKRDRKVFEAYQKESRAQRDRKDKEERAQLKKELGELREELREKELRWSSTLSRYRLRIETLESKNKELQSDLRMMEEQRLLQWQKQLESKRSPRQNRISTSKHSHSRPTINHQSPSANKGSVATSKKPAAAPPSSSKPSAPFINRATIDKRNATNKNAIKVVTEKNKGRKQIPPAAPLPSTSHHHSSTIPHAAPLQSMKRPQETKTLQQDNKKWSQEEEEEEEEEHPLLQSIHHKDRGSSISPDFSQIINEGLTSEEEDEEEEEGRDCVPHTSNDASIAESDCFIIDVKAVDVSAVTIQEEEEEEEEEGEEGEEGEGGSTSDSDLSQKADEIVSQVLQSASEQVLDNKTRTTIRHSPSPVPSTRPKAVRFSDGGGGGVGGANKEATCSSTNDDSNVRDERATVKSFNREEDGSKVFLYSNGTKKVVSSNGLTSVMYFFNGDIKRTEDNGDVVYYYSNSQTTHTTKPDGTEIIKFKNGQSETHYSNGCKEISFPDGTIRHLLLGGKERIEFSDGVVQHILPNGDKTIDFPDGQRETHTSLYKKREYPDGTVKTVYQDGRQETRYSNGRLRIKDANGRLIVDKMSSSPSVPIPSLVSTSTAPH